MGNPSKSMDVEKANTNSKNNDNKRMIFIVSPLIFMKYTREKEDFQSLELDCDAGHKKKKRRGGNN
jgi:hypothetical protein